MLGISRDQIGIHKVEQKTFKSASGNVQVIESRVNFKPGMLSMLLH